MKIEIMDVTKQDCEKIHIMHLYPNDKKQIHLYYRKSSDNWHHFLGNLHGIRRIIDPSLYEDAYIVWKRKNNAESKVVDI